MYKFYGVNNNYIFSWLIDAAKVNLNLRIKCAIYHKGVENSAIWCGNSYNLHTFPVFQPYIDAWLHSPLYLLLVKQIYF